MWSIIGRYTAVLHCNLRFEVEVWTILMTSPLSLDSLCNTCVFLPFQMHVTKQRKFSWEDYVQRGIEQTMSFLIML